MVRWNCQSPFLILREFLFAKCNRIPGWKSGNAAAHSECFPITIIAKAAAFSWREMSPRTPMHWCSGEFKRKLVPAPGAFFRLPKALSKMFSDKHKLTGCADIGAGIIDKCPHFGRKRVKISFHPGIFIFHSHHPGIVCPKP